MSSVAVVMARDLMSPIDTKDEMSFLGCLMVMI